METEQAHSGRISLVGRDAALRGRRIPQRRDAVPTVWLSLVCLDAPLVAVAWLWLFARTFHTTVDPAGCAALFLTAWLIYLADRLADSWTLPGAGLRSLRQEFCLRHRSVWIAVLTVIAIADAVLIWNLGPATFLAGAIVGTLALIHLVLNYSLGGAWPPLPLKEAAVGSLFAAGTLVPLFPSLSPITGSLIFSGIAFGLVCTLNCISIAFWERELDEAQQKVSFATRFPGFGPTFGKTLDRSRVGLRGVSGPVSRRCAHFRVRECERASSGLARILARAGSAGMNGPRWRIWFCSRRCSRCWS